MPQHYLCSVSQPLMLCMQTFTGHSFAPHCWRSQLTSKPPGCMQGLAMLDHSECHALLAALHPLFHSCRSTAPRPSLSKTDPMTCDVLTRMEKPPAYTIQVRQAASHSARAPSSGNKGAPAWHKALLVVPLVRLCCSRTTSSSAPERAP